MGWVCGMVVAVFFWVEEVREVVLETCDVGRVCTYAGW